MEQLKYPHEDPNYNEENYKKWVEYSQEYIKNHPIDMKDVEEDDLQSLKNYQLMFFSRPGRMGKTWTGFGLLQDDKLHLYRINSYDADGYGAVVRTFVGVEEVYDEVFKTTIEKAKVDNYEFVPTGFGGGLFVRKDIFSDYYKFVEGKCEEFKIGNSWQLWYNREDLAKMYYDDLNK